MSALIFSAIRVELNWGFWGLHRVWHMKERYLSCGHGHLIGPLCWCAERSIQSHFI